jgi:tetratricopeptide (TPR) repeat protein
LIPLVLASLSGISARPHLVDQAFENARRAIESDTPSATSAAEAAVAISQVAARFSWRADLWELAGIYSLEGGDSQTAREHLQRAAAAGRLSPQGLLALGDARRLNSDLVAAIQAWESALRSGGPADELHLRLAQAHRQSGSYPAAITDLQAYLDLHPTDAAQHYQLGLLLAAHQPEAALAHLIQAGDLDPLLAPKVKVLQRSIASARRSEDTTYTLLASGRALAALDEWELAAQAFSQVVKFRPDYAEAWAFLGEARQHIDADGLPEIQKALELDPDSLSANTFMALYWQRKDRSDLALVYLQKASRLDPGNPTLQAEIGKTLSSLGNLSVALSHYQRATELAPRDPTFWRLLATFSITYELEVRQVGLPAARQAVIFDPSDPAALDVMAQVFILLEDLPSAHRFLQRASQADPGYAPARLHLGLLFLLKDETARARQELELARSLSGPDDATAEHAQRLLDQLP